MLEANAFQFFNCEGICFYYSFRMKIRLCEEEVEKLLSDTCLKLGFCLPPPLINRIVSNPPADIDRFADVIYRGEGLDPSLKSLAYYQLRELVAEAFERHQYKK